MIKDNFRAFLREKFIIGSNFLIDISFPKNYAKNSDTDNVYIWSLNFQQLVLLRFVL